MAKGAPRRRPLWTALSLAAHLGVLAAVLQVGPEPSRPVELEPMPVALAPPRFLPPPPEPEPVPEPKPAPPRPPAPKAPPRLKARKPAPAPPDVTPLRVALATVTQPGDELSEAEAASAARAGSGSGGGGCDMARWLEAKLRADTQVRAAVAAVHHGRAILVWNGDWVPHPGQDGAGLAAVREAIMWEVAFAPMACRSEPVRGLVLLTLDDGPAPARVALGSGAWRWSDLLFARGAAHRERGG